MVESTGLRKRRLELRRKAVWEAAAIEFSRVGYEVATLEDIGRRLGLSKAGLYYYVEGKESLLIELADDAVAQIETAVEAVTADTTAGHRLRHFVSAHMSVALNTAMGQVLAANLDRLFSMPEARPVWERYEQSLRDILVAGIDTGEFREIDPVITSRMLLAAMNSTARWFDPEGAMPADDLVEQTVHTLLHGIHP